MVKKDGQFWASDKGELQGQVIAPDSMWQYLVTVSFDSDIGHCGSRPARACSYVGPRDSVIRNPTH